MFKSPQRRPAGPAKGGQRRRLAPLWRCLPCAALLAALGVCAYLGAFAWLLDRFGACPRASPSAVIAGGGPGAAADCPQLNPVTGELVLSTAKKKVVEIRPYEKLPIESEAARHRVDAFREARPLEPMGAKASDIGRARLGSQLSAALQSAAAAVVAAAPAASEYGDVVAIVAPASLEDIQPALDLLRKSTLRPARFLVSPCAGVAPPPTAAADGLATAAAWTAAAADWSEAVAAAAAAAGLPLELLDPAACADATAAFCAGVGSVKEPFVWSLGPGFSAGEGTLLRLRAAAAALGSGGGGAAAALSISAQVPPAPGQPAAPLAPGQPWREEGGAAVDLFAPTVPLRRACRELSRAVDAAGKSGKDFSSALGYLMRAQSGVRTYTVPDAESRVVIRAVQETPAAVTAESLPPALRHGCGAATVAAESVFFVVARPDDVSELELLYRSFEESETYAPHVVIATSSAAAVAAVTALKRLELSGADSTGGEGWCGVSVLDGDGAGAAGWGPLLVAFAPAAVVAVAVPENAPVIAAARLALDSDESLRDGTAILALPPADLPGARWAATLVPAALASWSRPNFGVSVVTHNRPTSLKRLLGSLLAAHYYGDQVSVDFYVENTADDETLRVVEAFSAQWGARGPVQVHFRVLKGGLIRAVTESYYPRDEHHHGVLLEDDIEVAPLWYAWAKLAALTYRYGAAEDFARDLYGVSLYTPRVNELAPTRYRYDSNKKMAAKIARRSGGKAAVATAVTAAAQTMPYLHETPCSWGAVYFAGFWTEYRAYLAARLTEDHVSAAVRKSRSNGWKTSWKRFFLEMAYQRRYYMLYPNYRDQASLATNWLEPGEHILQQAMAAGGAVVRGDERHKPADYTVPLLAGDADLVGLLLDRRLPRLSELPRMDILDLFVDELDAKVPPWATIGLPRPAVLATEAGAKPPPPQEPPEPLTEPTAEWSKQYDAVLKAMLSEEAKRAYVMYKLK